MLFLQGASPPSLFPHGWDIAREREGGSNYLHNGEAMYLSQFMSNPRGWDTDPSLGMIIDNRKFTQSKKLPYTFWNHSSSQEQQEIHNNAPCHFWGV